MRLTHADAWLAGHLWRGQAGQRILANLERDTAPPVPAWWLKAVELPSGYPYQALSLEGRIQLARVADWTSHQRTWGAHLVRQWWGPVLEHRLMHAYGLKFPQSAHPGYRKPAPETPQVTSWADRAAEALWASRGDHAAAYGLLDPSDMLARHATQLAPLRYSEAFGIWVRDMRDLADEG